MAVMTDSEGCSRESCSENGWLASKNVRWDPQPGEAVWHIGVLDKVLLHVRACLTIAQKHTMYFTSGEESHLLNCSLEDHLLECHYENSGGSAGTSGLAEDDLGPDAHSSGGIVCFSTCLLGAVAPPLNCVIS